MGLTIHYAGRFKKEAVLAEMIEEVIDVAEVNHWNYTVFNKEFDSLVLSKNTSSNYIYGVCFSPPNCEPVCLTFGSNGKMCSPFWLNQTDNLPEDRAGSCRISTKTQFAGFEVHAIIIRLFRHLSEKYFENFELYDEGQFWEFNNEMKSKEIFERYDNVMNTLADALKEIQIEKDEPLEEYIMRISEQIKSRKDKN
jgi:hypothetical protein